MDQRNKLSDGFWIPVQRGMMGIRDDVAAVMGITYKVRMARYRIRDEQHQITWVYDRLLGLSTE